MLPFTAPETGELFSNLLENACEACEKVKNKAFITLTVQTDSDSLQLELRNSVAVRSIFSEKGLPLTTKAGGGAGTRSTANVVKKYGGMLRFSQEGDVFVTRIILHMNKGEALSAANCNL